MASILSRPQCVKSTWSKGKGPLLMLPPKSAVCTVQSLWRHEEGRQKLSIFMMTSSNGNIFRVTGPLCGEFTCHGWIPLTKPSDAELWCFLWSVPWMNGWVKNREAGDIRRHRAHYDVIVMWRLAGGNAYHPAGKVWGREKYFNSVSRCFRFAKQSKRTNQDMVGEKQLCNNGSELALTD